MILVLGILLKALIILAVFSVLIIVHEAGHFFAAKKSGVKVERFALGFGKKIFGIKKGETEYLLNIIPLGGYVKLAGEDPYERKGKVDEFYSKPIKARLGILLSGPLFNYIFALLILVVLYMIGKPALTNQVGMVLEGSPAEAAGIKARDKIVSIDKEPVKHWDELVKIIRADEDARPLDIKIKRNEKFFNIKVIPRVISAENIFKQNINFVGIGIAPSEEVIILKSHPLESFDLAARHVWFFTVATYRGLWLLITGAMPIKENIGGPIRIIDMLAKAIQYGWYSVMSMMATISLALAIFNLLPFPILDGGHILFLGIEKLRGKPLSTKTQEIVTQAAFVLLVAFVLYVSYYDVRAVANLKK